MSNGRFSIEAAFKAIDRFSAPVSKMQDSLSRFTKAASGGLNRTSEVTSKVSGGLQAVAGAAVGLGVLGGAALFHVGKAGADFEQAITNVGAVMGKPRSQIQDLEKAAMSLGVTTQFSASEVADGMEMMARKGFDAQEILQGIPGVLNAVAASGEDMATVTTLVGSTVRGFGLQAAATSHVADILAYTAEKTGATITDLGTALATAAPTAKALGVSLEDTTAAVGLMQKIGIDSSTAGTAVATMLAKISKPSHEAAQEMANLGIKFQDAKGDMLPFRDVLGQFVKAGDKTGGNMKRMAFFAELVGLRGDKAALALSDMAKSGEFDKLVAGLMNVAGYSQKVADLRMDTTEGSWKLLTSTVEVLETKLFDLKSGTIKGVIDQTNAWVAANDNIIVQRVQDTVQEIADHLPQIKQGLTDIAIGVAAFYTFEAAVKVAQAATVGFDLAMGSAAIAGTLLSGAVDLITAATDASALSTGAATAAAAFDTLTTKARKTALMGYTAISWLGFGAAVAFTMITGIQTKNTNVNAAATWLATSAQTAWNSIVEFGSTIFAGATLETLGMSLAYGGLALVLQGVALAQGFLNGIMAANPFFLIGIAVLALIGYIVHLAGGWQALGDTISGWGHSVMASIQPVIDHVKEMIGWIEKAGGAVGGLLGFGAGPPPPPGGEAHNSGEYVPSQMVSPYDPSRNDFDTGVSGEITIKDQTGRASVTKAPKGRVSMPLFPASGSL